MKVEELLHLREHIPEEAWRYYTHDPAIPAWSGFIFFDKWMYVAVRPFDSFAPGMVSVAIFSEEEKVLDRRVFTHEEVSDICAGHMPYAELRPMFERILKGQNEYERAKRAIP